MNTPTFLQTQQLELTRLLEQSGDDPVIAQQLQERLASVEQEVKDAGISKGELLPKETPALPRAAIFLRGDSVKDSDGIRAGLAGEALLRYEQMYIQQAIHDEREAAQKAGRQRRRRGAPEPSLLFTATPRGSFGLEFVPQFSDDPDALEIHKASLDKIAAALVRVGQEQDSGEAIEGIPDQVLKPLKQFLSTLASHRAELRVAFADKPSQSVDASSIASAAERLERDIKVDEVEKIGTFRGVTRESGYVDIKLEDESVITANVPDEFTEEDLERIDLMTNCRGRAVLQQTTITSFSNTVSERFVLLEAQPIDQ